MEMGSTESLNGLKFGRKIYFEDSSSSSSCPVGPKKGRSGSVQGGQPPRCQVEGCEVDLSDAKAYYSRHKVCGTHSKASQVIVAGREQRFCQQCSRFHLLPEFDQGKRSCRRRLAGHNERRRKPPPGSFLPASYGEASSGRVSSFVMDFSAYPRVGAAGGAPQRTAGRHLPHLWQGGSNPESAPPFPPPDRFMQTSMRGTSLTAGHGIPPPVSDSSCALSLLSNQQLWAQRTRSPSEFMLHPEMNNMASAGSCQNLPHIGIGQSSQPERAHFSGERDLSHHQSRRLYLDPGLAMDFDASAQQHMNWSL